MNEELKVIISVEVDKLKKGVEDAKKSVGSFKDEVKKHSKDASDNIKKIGDTAKKVGKTIATGIAAGATALGALGIKALNAKGELEQGLGGSEAVYKQYATNIQGYAKEAFANMGLSTSEYLETANKMGALFQGSGFSIKESMDLSSQAMQRAADVASIMGIDTSAAMDAVAGAAKGNFTMMDNLGVAMNDTSIGAYALQKGIKKTTQEMTQQEKIGLAMEMFLDKTAYAAGNYKKENDTLAGSLSTCKAAFTNFIDGSGDFSSLLDSVKNAKDVVIKTIDEMLAPYPEIQKIVDTAISAVETIATSLGDAVSFVVDNWDTISPILTGIAVAIGVITAAVTAYNAVQAVKVAMDAAEVTSVGALIAAHIASAAATMVALAPYIAIAAAIAAVIAVIVLCVKHWDKIKAKVKEVAEAIGKKVQEMKEKVVNKFNEIKDGMKQKIDDAKQAVKDKFQQIKDGITEKVEAAKTAVKTKFDEIKSGISEKVTAVKTKVTDTFNAVKTAITSPVEKARDDVKAVVDKIKGFFHFTWSLPKLKVPHFSITPAGWKVGDLLKGSIPKLGVSWNAKGGVFDTPTLFAGNGGLQGLGENGAEAVVPLEKNTKWLDKIAAKLGANNNRPIYLTVNGKVFAETTIDALNDYTNQTGRLPIKVF